MGQNGQRDRRVQDTGLKFQAPVQEEDPARLELAKRGAGSVQDVKLSPESNAKRTRGSERSHEVGPDVGAGGQQR